MKKRIALFTCMFATAICGILNAAIINLDAGQAGRVFEGIGLVNSSGTSKLLMDYPQEQREQILDLLFKPGYGAALTIIKNEIGSDSNTSSGTEPSHMRAADETPSARGVNFWMCREAKKINDKMKFGAGRWGMPAWAASSMEAKQKYYLAYVETMKNNNTPLDFLAPDENEGAFDRDWVAGVLRPALDEAGYRGLSLVAKDGPDWNIAYELEKDPELKSAVAGMNCHYRTDGDPAALESGLPLYNDEADTPMRGAYAGMMSAAMNIARQYIDGRMTRLLYQPALDCVYDSIKYNGKGIITANTPWSGHYEVHPSLWMTAHYTRFIKPGWVFMDNACGAAGVDDDEYYLSARDTDTGDYSIVIVNNSDNARIYAFKAGKGLSKAPVHAYRTRQNEQFVKRAVIKPEAGEFRIMAAPRSIYSITTLTGVKKGGIAGKIPADRPLPLPYSEPFTGYADGSQPRYFHDQAGAFEIASGGDFKFLKQVITTPPVEWRGDNIKRGPYTVFGDMRWRGCGVSADVLIGDDSYALISGRGVLHNRDSGAPPSGYQLELTSSGVWTLRKNNFGAITDFASATLNAFDPDKWHNIMVSMEGSTITAYVDGALLTQANDSTFACGQAAIGCSCTGVIFDNITVRGVSGADNGACTMADDDGKTMKFTGSWEREEGTWMDMGRGASKSANAGDTMEFAFSGTGFFITGRLFDYGGKADVYVDGVKRKSIDTYDPGKVHRAQLCAVDGLKNTGHKVKLLVTGENGAGSKGSIVYIDTAGWF
ncbi:MAG: hypothetical protein LLG37_03005 [Spirochaetia bacterium]|nr:hypothetical protein [Spirochaetia bacterium]